MTESESRTPVSRAAVRIDESRCCASAARKPAVKTTSQAGWTLLWGRVGGGMPRGCITWLRCARDVRRAPQVLDSLPPRPVRSLALHLAQDSGTQIRVI